MGYVGAATVEFLYVLQEQRFYFLELNPRLQVEHPVTEWLSGVNIPACQVMIGMGIPLHAMPEITALFPDGMDCKFPEQVRLAWQRVRLVLMCAHAATSMQWFVHCALYAVLGACCIFEVMLGCV